MSIFFVISTEVQAKIKFRIIFVLMNILMCLTDALFLVQSLADDHSGDLEKSPVVCLMPSESTSLRAEARAFNSSGEERAL